MNLKHILKNYKMTQSKLAKTLYISRPTLSTYLEMFENNESLPNEKYQLIFEKLFDEKNTNNEFYNYLNKYSDLIKKDEMLGTKSLNPTKTDTIYYLINEMKADLDNDEKNENVFIFIRMLLNSYKNPYFKDIMDYFLALNKLIDLEKMEETKQKKLSLYYHLFTKIRDNKLKYENEMLEKFRERILEIEQKKDEAKTKLESAIKEKINIAIQRELDLGKDISKLQIEEIIKNIK